MNKFAGMVLLLIGGILTLLFGLLTLSAVLAQTWPGLLVFVPGIGLSIWMMAKGRRLRKEMPLPPLPADPDATDLTELRESLLALNNEDLPFQVREAKPDEEAHLVAEWKVLDAKWIALIHKARIKRVFAVLMRFDPDRREVRTVDVDQSVSTGLLSFARSAHRGQQFSMQWGRSWGIKEDGSLGEIYRYSFDTRTIKNPLRALVEEAGWKWKRIVWGRL